MTTITLHQNSYLKNINRNQIKDIKNNSLQNCFAIKDQQCEGNKQLLNNISLKMQKLLNKGNLNTNDIEIFISQMKKANIKPEDCENFLMNMLNIIKHNTNSQTKINWFGNINKTNSLNLFLNDNYANLENLSGNMNNNVLHLHYKGHILRLIAVCYNSLEYHNKAADCFKNILNNHLKSLDVKLNEYYKSLYTGSSISIVKISSLL